jgi:hypothetical protein
MNATIAWTAGACLVVGWVAGFLFGTAEAGHDPERDRAGRLLREGLLEEATDLAELEEAMTGTGPARSGGPEPSRDRVPAGAGASSSVLT